MNLIAKMKVLAIKFNFCPNLRTLNKVSLDCIIEKVQKYKIEKYKNKKGTQKSLDTAIALVLHFKRGTKGYMVIGD